MSSVVDSGRLLVWLAKSASEATSTSVQGFDVAIVQSLVRCGKVRGLREDALWLSCVFLVVLVVFCLLFTHFCRATGQPNLWWGSKWRQRADYLSCNHYNPALLPKGGHQSMSSSHLPF